MSELKDILAKKKRKSRKNQCPDSGLYQALMAYFLHQDQIYWSYSQLLIAVQAGALAAGYATRTNWLGPTVLLLGALLSFLVLLLVLKAGWDRDVNLHVLDKLARDLLADPVKSELRDEGRQEPFIRFGATPPRWFQFARGRYILIGVLIGLIILDVLLACLFKWAPNWFPLPIP